MGALINFLVLVVLLLAGLGQTHSLPPRVAYAIAIPLAVITFALAIVRYRRRKSASHHRARE
ncbi:MAG TPA: hypothetical protein VII08_07450 [Myxococcales bacterium]|jgi:hypothetical protein